MLTLLLLFISLREQILNTLSYTTALDIGMIQGDRTKNIGVIDSEYVVHQGIQTLGGGPPTRKVIHIAFIPYLLLRYFCFTSPSASCNLVVFLNIFIIFHFRLQQLKLS